MIDKLTATATLPDGTTVALAKDSANTITLDERWSPYVQAKITVPAPANLSAFDPRVGSPRVQITAIQSFSESDPVSVLTGLYGVVSGSSGQGQIFALSSEWGSGTVAAMSARFTRLWNAGDYRTPITRVFDLGIRRRNLTADGQLELTLASDEALLQDQASFNSANSPGTLQGLVNDVLSRLLSGTQLTTATVDMLLTAFRTSSIGTPVVAWPPDKNGWDFISTFLPFAAARLFCDENRQWSLVSSTYNRGGSVTIAQASNLVDFNDDINRDGEWFSAVVFKYTWTKYNTTDGSSAGTAMSYEGAAGVAPAKVYFETRDLGNQAVDFTPPFGAPAVLRARLMNLGRDIPTTGLFDITAQPGADLTLTLPRGAVTGHVTAVTFDLSKAEMSITARDIP